MKTKRTTKSTANPKIRREAAKRMSNAEIWAQVKAERANTPNACREMLAQMLKEREAEKAVAAAAAAAATAANPVTSPVANDSGHATTGPNNAAWDSTDERAARTAAFVAKQESEHAEAEARKAKDKVDRLKKLEADASAAREAATHCVPCAPTLGDVFDSVVTG